MVAPDNNVLDSTDAEMVLAGHAIKQHAAMMSLTQDFTTQNMATTEDFYDNDQLFAGAGTMDLDIRSHADIALRDLRRQWRDYDSADEQILVWAEEGAIAIGQPISATLITPSALGRGVEAQAPVSQMLTGAWRGDNVYGILRSGSGQADDQILSADLAATSTILTDIDTRGPDIYSPVVAVPNSSGKPTLCMAVIRGHVGSDETRPTLTFNFPADWQNGAVPASANNTYIRITHKGTRLSTRVLTTGRLVGSIQQDLESLRWPDGFQINAQSNFAGLQAVSITITGNHYGEGEDIEMFAGNPPPWNVGSAEGSGGGTMAQLVSATGAGGSRVYQGLTELRATDPHHPITPISAIVPAGVEQLAVRYQVPEIAVGSPPYDYQMRQIICWAIDGDVV